MTNELVIPTLDNEETVVRVIDELKHRLKAPGRGVVGDALNEALNEIITEHRLDTDPHMHAVMEAS